MSLVRQVLSSVILIALCSFTNVSYAADAKAVYDLTTGDAEKIESRLLNGIKYISKYYKKEGIEFKAVVAISGESYKYFIADLDNSPFKDDKQLADIQKKLAPLIKELHDDYGVRFDMCGAGMQARKIKAASLYSFVHTDKVKPVYMIDWQNKGYAYMPMH